MYCKNCGKKQLMILSFVSIAELHSNKCKLMNLHKQQSNLRRKIKLEVPTIETNLSDKAKIGIGVYTGWVLLNFLCIFLDANSTSYASENFYPFDSDRIRYYDFTEFLVYTIIAPLAIYGLYKLWKYLKK